MVAARFLTLKLELGIIFGNIVVVVRQWVKRLSVKTGFHLNASELNF